MGKCLQKRRRSDAVIHNHRQASSSGGRKKEVWAFPQKNRKTDSYLCCCFSFISIHQEGKEVYWFRLSVCTQVECIYYCYLCSHGRGGSIYMNTYKRAGWCIGMDCALSRQSIMFLLLLVKSAELAVCSSKPFQTELQLFSRRKIHWNSTEWIGRFHFILDAKSSCLMSSFRAGYFGKRFKCSKCFKKFDHKKMMLYSYQGRLSVVVI